LGIFVFPGKVVEGFRGHYKAGIITAAGVSATGADEQNADKNSDFTAHIVLLLFYICFL
jgi:hypothetical protein